MFALMAGSALFFKVDDSTRAVYEDAGSKRYRAMPYYQVPEHVMEDAGALKEWARGAISVGHATAKRKVKKNG